MELSMCTWTPRLQNDVWVPDDCAAVRDAAAVAALRKEFGGHAPTKIE
jgi:hypothetical protein